MRKIRLLLADDHTLFRAGLRILIEAQDDMEVIEEASTAEETIVRVQGMRPDVVLLDITLPDKSGVAAIEDIRQIAPQTRILILSMHDDPAYARAAMAAGSAGYLVKTATESELISAVRMVHRGRSYINIPLHNGDLRDLVEAQAAEKKRTAVLSQREREVLVRVAQGYTHKEIAEKLLLSIKSVETYRARAAKKLGLRTRVELVRYALETGLLQSSRAGLS